MSISAVEPFWNRVGNAFSNPMDAIDGGLWGVFAGVDTVFFTKSLIERIQLCYDGKADGDLIFEANKDLALKSAGLVGSTTSTLDWADRVEIIALEGWKPIVSAAGYAAYLFTAAWNGWDAILNFNESAEKGSLNQQTVALLKLATCVCTVAWAVLGIIALAVTSAGLTLAMEILVLTWIGFMVVHYVYKQCITPAEESSVQNLPAST